MNTDKDGTRYGISPATSHSPRALRSRRAEETRVLLDVWHKQIEYAQASGNMDSLHQAGSHFTDITLARRFMMADQSTPYVHDRVLEWGCNAGVDACIYRMRFGDSIDLTGCDLNDSALFEPLFSFSGIKYTRLDHPYELPYKDASFDVVTSLGVLEHVPDDLNSVREIRRVLEPGGVFAITCLPNQWSYTEAFQRWRGATAHDRLYTIRSATRLLEENGFKVIRTRYCLMVPTMLNGFPQAIQRGYQRFARGLWALNAILEWTPLVNRLASNLTLIAVKQ
jgi:SAM-dependent methyltransferase